MRARRRGLNDRKKRQRIYINIASGRTGAGSSAEECACVDVGVHTRHLKACGDPQSDYIAEAGMRAWAVGVHTEALQGVRVPQRDYTHRMKWMPLALYDMPWLQCNAQEQRVSAQSSSAGT